MGGSDDAQGRTRGPERAKEALPRRASGDRRSQRGKRWPVVTGRQQRFDEVESGADARTSIAKACKAAAVPLFSPHDLRHRRISLLHLRGVPWARIGEFVGQRNLAVTANTYSHVLRRRGRNRLRGSASCRSVSRRRPGHRRARIDTSQESLGRCALSCLVSGLVPAGPVSPGGIQLAHVDRPGQHRIRTVYGRRPEPGAPPLAIPTLPLVNQRSMVVGCTVAVEDVQEPWEVEFGENTLIRARSPRRNGCKGRTFPRPRSRTTSRSS